MPDSLPIDAVLPDLTAALAAHGRAVLMAPPGAGKTTRVPLALLPVIAGRIVMLEPRRLAARAAAEPARCPDCPARLNRPQTEDGWQVWDLVGRLGGQLRVIPGAVLGWDMGAALAMAQALGIDTLIAAELLPEIEAVMVRKLNEQMEGGRDG